MRTMVFAALALAACAPEAPTSRPAAPGQTTEHLMARPLPRAPASPPAPAPPPGAPPDWLARVRDPRSRSRLKTFPVFDVVFDYRDADGNVTQQRRVTVTEMDVKTFGRLYRPGLLYVTGWCHTRQAMRTFRIDEMANIIDPVHNVPPADPRAWFLAHARHD